MWEEIRWRQARSEVSGRVVFAVAALRVLQLVSENAADGDVEESSGEAAFVLDVALDRADVDHDDDHLLLFGGKEGLPEWVLGSFEKRLGRVTLEDHDNVAESDGELRPSVGR